MGGCVQDIGRIGTPTTRSRSPERIVDHEIEALVAHRARASLGVRSFNLCRQAVLQSLFVGVAKRANYRGFEYLRIDDFLVSVEVDLEEILGHLN